MLVAPDGTLVESLTSRERDILRLLATGARNAEVADALGMSAGTAKWHVAHVLAKLGVTSRTGAVVRGQELGLALISGTPASAPGPRPRPARRQGRESGGHPSRSGGVRGVRSGRGWPP